MADPGFLKRIANLLFGIIFAKNHISKKKIGLGGARIPRTPIDPPLTLELNYISRMSNTDNLLGDHCQAAQSFCVNTHATYITFKKGLKSHLFNEYCM